MVLTKFRNDNKELKSPFEGYIDHCLFLLQFCEDVSNTVAIKDTIKRLDCE